MRDEGYAACVAHARRIALAAPVKEALDPAFAEMMMEVAGPQPVAPATIAT
jgi:hypothetical protein